MKKNKKIICLVLAGLIVVSAVAGIFFLKSNRYDKTDFTVLDLSTNSNNYVDFKSDVHIAENPAEIQKNYEMFSINDKEYTIVYRKAIPNFFKKMGIGEIFCVYPDSSATESFFALGFCGILTAINEEKGKYSVTFAVPELTDIFSEIYIDTRFSDSGSISTMFYPSEKVVDVKSTQKRNNSYMFLCAEASAASLEDSLTIGDTTIGYKFQKPERQSLLDDYVLIGEELTLNIERTADNGIFNIGGSVTLEEMAVKMLLDYHYDETTNTAEIKDYSLGFITKQKLGLSLSVEKSIGLEDFNADLSEKTHIIDIDDVTESEKGKIVLGTYVIGWDAALPILENNRNKVSYLSLGIAVQLSVTASGTLSLEYNIEEAGFAQVEVNGSGENKYLNKGYEYPNPVKESRQPTEEELSSVPNITSNIKGEASFDMAFGTDIGICILGMIPVKLANNFAEVELTKTFTEELLKDETAEVIRNNYLLDDNVDSLIVSSNSYLKMHLGTKINFGDLKYTVAEIGGSIQLFKDVWYQSPPAIGFSHAQCGFGGVFAGETYSDDELDETFKNYMKDTDQDSLLTSAKDLLFGSLINTALNNWGLELLDIASYLGEDIDEYKINYYTSGILYVRDKNNRVVAVFVMGEEIANAAGIHNGLSPQKIEQIYSAPDLSAEVSMNIGSFAKNLLGINWLKNADLAGSTYYSCDSNEQMDLIFCNNSLEMIIVTAK